MLAKKYRLNLSNKENATVFSKEGSKTLTSRYFLSYFRVNESGFKAACISPKGALSKATQRNYYRRLIYSLLEEELKKDQAFFSSNLDLVLVLKRNFSKDEKELKEDFSTLLLKIKKNLNK